MMPRMPARVRIHSFANRKIHAIKIVRQMTGYGLKESKETVERGDWFTPGPGQLEHGCQQLREQGCEIEVEGSESSPGAATTSASSLAQGSYVLRVMSAPRKIHAIKLVRELDGSGLREAKDTVEQQRALGRSMTRDEAERALARFVEIGAEVRIEPAGAGQGGSPGPERGGPTVRAPSSSGSSAWDDEDDYDF